MTDDQVVIYTDGACEPNPGPGGYGVVLLRGDERTEFRQGYSHTTNNRMEIMAAIAGLEALPDPMPVVLHSDSKYVVDAMTLGWARSWQQGGWIRKGGKRVPNADLWERLLELDDRHTVTYRWVRGHSGDRLNERADALSYAAIEDHDKLEDVGYLDPLGLDEGSSARITRAGQPCRKCGTPVIKRTPRRRKKPGQVFYYEYYLHCPNCQTNYMVEEAKRYYQDGPSA